MIASFRYNSNYILYLYNIIQTRFFRVRLSLKKKEMFCLLSIVYVLPMSNIDNLSGAFEVNISSTLSLSLSLSLDMRIRITHTREII